MHLTLEDQVHGIVMSNRVCHSLCLTGSVHALRSISSGMQARQLGKESGMRGGKAASGLH